MMLCFHLQHPPKNETIQLRMGKMMENSPHATGSGRPTGCYRKDHSSGSWWYWYEETFCQFLFCNRRTLHHPGSPFEHVKGYIILPCLPWYKDLPFLGIKSMLPWYKDDANSMCKRHDQDTARSKWENRKIVFCLDLQKIFYVPCSAPKFDILPPKYGADCWSQNIRSVFQTKVITNQHRMDRHWRSCSCDLRYSELAYCIHVTSLIWHLLCSVYAQCTCGTWTRSSYVVSQFSHTNWNREPILL